MIFKLFTTMHMRYIFTLIFGLAALAALGQAQPLLTEGFEYDAANFQREMDSRFDQAGVVRQDTNAANIRSGKSSLFLADKGLLATRNALRAPGLVQFWIKPPQYDDNYILTIEISTDRVNWQELPNAEIRQIGNPDAPASSNFRFITRPINSLENVFIRWRIKTYASGFLSLDDITVLPITEEARRAALARQEEERFRSNFDQMIRSFDEKRSSTEAVRSIELTRDNYFKRVYSLAKLVDRSNSIKIIAGTSTALATRNQMSNPMAYREFQSTVSELNNVLDTTNRLFLKDLVSSLQRNTDRFQQFQERASKVLNVASAVGNIITGGRLDVFVSSFKSLIPQAFSRQNLLNFPQFQPDRKGNENPSLISTLARGPQMYTRTKEFLEVISEENQRANELNNTINELYKDATLLNGEIQDFTLEYLRTVGVQADNNLIIRLSNNDNQAFELVKTQVDKFFNDMIAQRRAGTNFDEQRKLLERTDRHFGRVGFLVERYNALSNNMAGFYQSFINDLDRENPFENRCTPATRDFWKVQRDQALVTIRDVSESYRKSYLNYNFY